MEHTIPSVLLNVGTPQDIHSWGNVEDTLIICDLRTTSHNFQVTSAERTPPPLNKENHAKVSKWCTTLVYDDLFKLAASISLIFIRGQTDGKSIAHFSHYKIVSIKKRTLSHCNPSMSASGRFHPPKIGTEASRHIFWPALWFLMPDFLFC